MDIEAKISPAFEQFLGDSGPHDKRDAIVIYQSGAVGEQVRGRLCSLKQRLHWVKERAAAQVPIQEKLLSDYRKEGGKLSPKARGLDVAPIGSNTLPVAAVQVTRLTLPALAQRDEVVAIMPNQRIHLIKPKEIDYSQLGKQESKDGLTWGLKQLNIPEVWRKAKTQGRRHKCGRSGYRRAR